MFLCILKQRAKHEGLTGMQPDLVHRPSGGTRFFFFLSFCVCGGHRGDKMCFWGSKIWKICQKWLIFANFSSACEGASGVQSLQLGGFPCAPPPWCHRGFPCAPLGVTNAQIAIWEPLFQISKLSKIFNFRNHFGKVSLDEKASLDET